MDIASGHSMVFVVIHANVQFIVVYVLYKLQSERTVYAATMVWYDDAGSYFTSSVNCFSMIIAFTLCVAVIVFSQTKSKQNKLKI